MINVHLTFKRKSGAVLIHTNHLIHSQKEKGRHKSAPAGFSRAVQTNQPTRVVQIDVIVCMYTTILCRAATTLYMQMNNYTKCK